MRSTFFLGIIAGVVATLALAWFAPFLNQERVRSITDVQNNGGRVERFEIRLPDDLLSSVPGIDRPDGVVVPASAEWYPELAPFYVHADVYRLRNEQGVVVGIASRVRGVQTRDDVEWVLDLPARGTLAMNGLSADIAEVGTIVSGTREFTELGGSWEARLDEDNVWRIDTVVQRLVGEDE
ncbi:MAG: hypothetical protein AAF004_10510 [Pseudomonadota bacterium]